MPKRSKQMEMYCVKCGHQVEWDTHQCPIGEVKPRGDYPITHELKSWPVFFSLSLSGWKNVEIRLNDRDYRAGDTLVLREFDLDYDLYSGRQLSCVVADVIRKVPGLQEGYVMLLLAQKCRVCGCTDDQACPDGCSWVEPDLCSACEGG